MAPNTCGLMTASETLEQILDTRALFASSALSGPARMCKYPGPVRLERATHARFGPYFDALSCPAKDVATLGYLKDDQTFKNVHAAQVSLSTAKEAAPEPEVAPRRTFTKGGRVRKCWDSGEWALSQQQLSLPADELASLPAAEMDCLPRCYWAAPTEATAKPTRRSRFAPAE